MCKKVIIGSNGVKLDTCQIFNLRLTYWIQTSLAWCLLLRTHGMLIWINTNRNFGGTVSACWRQRNSSCIKVVASLYPFAFRYLLTVKLLQTTIYRSLYTESFSITFFINCSTYPWIQLMLHLNIFFQELTTLCVHGGTNKATADKSFLLMFDACQYQHVQESFLSSVWYLDQQNHAQSQHNVCKQSSWTLRYALEQLISLLKMTTLSAVSSDSIIIIT